VVKRSVVEKSGCDREKRACSPVATRGSAGTVALTGERTGDSCYSNRRFCTIRELASLSCSMAKMGSRIASSCPPMTLREREVLNTIQLGFLIPPLPSIFQASATQVLTKAVGPLETLQNSH
jgi:hypothetical protein